MQDSRSYRTLKKRVRHESDPIKKSRFIAEAHPVKDEAAAAAVVATIRNQMPDANHHCWAYQVGQPVVAKSSDDGEPSGSAGRPILSQIMGRDLLNLVVVVSRFFGGTKLGVGGLVRAYAGAAAGALDSADIITVTPTRPLLIRYDYNDTTLIQAALNALDLNTHRTDYTDRVTSLLQIPAGDWDTVREALIDHTNGKILFSSPEDS